MKDGATYPRNTALAILLSGAPGAGKSNLCMDFANPWFIDADKNLRNAIERHPNKQFYYDDPELSADGKPLPPEQHWARLEALIKENGPRPEVGAIVGDGLGRISDYLKAFLVHKGGMAEKPLVVGGLNVMTMSLWGPFADLLKKLVFLCRSYNKPFILTTHLGVDENELSQIKEQKVLLQGSLRNDFPKLFTDFWMCEAKPNSADKYKPYGVRYSVRTAPDIRITLKQSCGLPAEFEPTDEVFKKLIASISAPVA